VNQRALYKESALWLFRDPWSIERNVEPLRQNEPRGDDGIRWRLQRRHLPR